ncbi:MAG: PTS sugar transporter subunit IIA [Spirochaetales bacterium]|nr:PTS sugar transporter subunit IIA [Spirochaetales bacterium]
MALLDLVMKDRIKVPLTSANKNDILYELVQILVDAGVISDREEAFRVVRKREDQSSTGLADGIAVPHAKTALVQKLTMAIGICPEGVDFDALDRNPSKIFFLMLAPPDQSGPHIEALSEIARITRSAAFVRVLASARNADEVVELFEG